MARPSTLLEIAIGYSEKVLPASLYNPWVKAESNDVIVKTVVDKLHAFYRREMYRYTPDSINPT